MSQIKDTLMEAFTQFWDERQGRERQYIVAGVFFVGALLIYLIGVDPALTGIQELKKQLPVLHQQSVEMQQLAQELQNLPSVDNREDVSKEAIEASLKSVGMVPQSLSVVDGVVRVQVNSTSMATLQAWLLEMQKMSGLFVKEMKITGLEQGMISATFMLQQANGGG